MKTMFQLLLVTLIFGGAAAVATVFWQKQQSELQTALQRAEAAESKAVAENPLADLQKPSPKPAGDNEPDEEQLEPPVAVRPPYVEGLDETSQLVVSLNQRLRATQEKERKLDERQVALMLIFSDIRAEQVEINKLRQEVDNELDKSSQFVREAMKAAQDERDLLRQELDSLRSPTQSDAATPLPVNDQQSILLRSPTQSGAATSDDQATPTSPPAQIDSDPAALKRLGVIYDSMPAEVVAEVLQQLTKQNRDAAVVEILKSMKDRQAAKVLATIAAADPAKAAALTELLKR
jgi:flagellar motility protein MotE (MotC chaperone)